MTPALQTTDLAKRYAQTWALRDCTLTLPAGRIAALVGPNGAGKTTLLQLAVGLDSPTRGGVQIFGWSPREQPTLVLPRIGFLAQERPLYKGFTVGEMLTMGRKLNPRWGEGLARTRLDRIGIPLERRVGQLSGGQQAQVALVLALAKRPELLLLDEPVAALDPLARREFLQALLEATVEAGLTVLMSSHIIGDLERVCDYLISLSASRVVLTGDIEHIIQRHKLLTGPRQETEAVAHLHNVVQATHAERQTTLLVRTNGHIWDPSWQVHSVSLEEIVLAYLGQPMSDEPTVVLEPGEEEVLV
jgi:ABC-2 type transport system ATP-binding protein